MRFIYSNRVAWVALVFSGAEINPVFVRYSVQLERSRPVPARGRVKVA